MRRPPVIRIGEKGDRALVGYHICQTKRLPHYDYRMVKDGSLFGVKGRIEICQNGLHASPTIHEAEQYTAPYVGGILSLVVVWGNIQEDGFSLDYRRVPRKFCGRFRLHLVTMELTCSDVHTSTFNMEERITRSGVRRFNDLILRSQIPTIIPEMDDLRAGYKDLREHPAVAHYGEI